MNDEPQNDQDATAAPLSPDRETTLVDDVAAVLASDPAGEDQLGAEEPTPALAELPVAPDAVIGLSLPSTPPDFKATHELVFGDGTVVPVILREAFLAADGTSVTRRVAEERGYSIRRVLPR